MNITTAIDWNEVFAVRPVHHVDDLVVWLDPGGVLQATSRDRALRWRREGFGPRQPLRAPIQFFGRFASFQWPDRREWIELTTGKTVWQRAERIGSVKLSLVGDRFYTVHDVDDSTSVLAELDVRDGSERTLLTRHTGRSFELQWLDDDLIVALEGDCVGVDRATGQTRWSTTVERRARLPGGGIAVPCGSALNGGDLIVLPIGAFGFIALRRATGEVAWEHPTDGGGQETALAIGDRIRWLTSRAYQEIDLVRGTVTVDRYLGDQTFAIGLGADLVGMPVVLGHRLFAVGDRGIAFAYDTASDRVDWHHQLGARSSYACQPSLAHGNLWLMDVTGRLHVFVLPQRD